MSVALLVLTCTLGAVTVLSGALLLRYSPARWCGGVLAATGALVLVGGIAASVGADGTVAWAVAGYLGAPLAFVVFPTPAWGRPAAALLVAAVVGAGGTAALWPTSRDVGTIVLFVVLVAKAWWTIERGRPGEPRAMIWASVVWGGVLLAIGVITFLADGADVGGALWSDAIALALLHLAPVAMVIGAVRPELIDVHALATSIVVTGATLLTFIAIGVGFVAAFEWVTGVPVGQTGTIVVCAVIAFGAHPLRRVLRGMIDRLLFGDRPDPLATATRLADGIGDDAAVALDAVREALVLPYASLVVDDVEVASGGAPVSHTRRIPLRLGGSSEGAIVVGLRTGDFTLSVGDEEVLRIVAPLLALTLRYQRLAAELAQSRNGLVSAVEEERRRLRRDLHDGLGPRLTGVAFAADAATNYLRSSPERAADLLVGLRTDVAEAIVEVRRVIDGLRPPALDELGLVSALQEWARRLRGADGRELVVHFDAPATVVMPAAREVAAFRIVVEALTNVARHSDSPDAAVRIGLTDSELRLEVTDHGTSGAWTPGVGISSMVERARRVGGDLQAAATPVGGRVVARIPLGA